MGAILSFVKAGPLCCSADWISYSKFLSYANMGYVDTPYISKKWHFCATHEKCRVTAKYTKKATNCFAILPQYPNYM
jgi:hypothetical protein